MVFFAAPVMRTVPRIELPSTKHPMICARFSMLKRFILTIMLEASDGKHTLTDPRRAKAPIPWPCYDLAQAPFTEVPATGILAGQTGDAAQARMGVSRIHSQTSRPTMAPDTATRSYVWSFLP